MKNLHFLVVGIVSVVSAQNPNSLPACAGPCVDAAIAATGCQATDVSLPPFTISFIVPFTKMLDSLLLYIKYISINTHPVRFRELLDPR